METIKLIKDYTTIVKQQTASPSSIDPYNKQPLFREVTYKSGQLVSGKWNYTHTYFIVDGEHNSTIPVEYIMPQPTIELTTTNYKFAPKTPLESEQLQQHKGINMPTLDLDYFNSDKCVIIFETHEEVVELHKAGIAFCSTLLDYSLFQRELQDYGTIALIRKNGWGRVENYSYLPQYRLQDVITALKGKPMNIPQHELDLLKSHIVDIPQYLKSGDRIFVVTTFDEAKEIHHLTGVQLPAVEIFNRQLAHYGGIDIAFKDHKGWINSEDFKNPNNHPKLTLQDVKYLLDIPEVAPMVPLAPEPAIERELWRNPKPSKKNTQPISGGSYFLVDGCEIPQTYVGSIPVEQCYPLHKLLPEQKPKIGDIIQVGDVWTVIKSKEDKSNYYDNLWRITDENNKAIQVMNLNRYSCGTIIDNDSQKILPTIPAGVKIDTDYSYDFTWEHKQISNHFDVDMELLHTQDEILHKQLSITLDHELNVARKEWAYIWGPSGSGKSTLAVDYANSVNRPYILQQGTSQLTVDDLLGYKSITTGEYFPSLLRDAVENGKIFILDEADACNANSILCLNALKHGTFQFPDALVDIHPAFRLIMTANTCNDYSEDYSSRNPLDKATLDRCAIIEYNMKDYHLALRYGLSYIKQITDLDNKSPRQIEREITNMKIKETT